MPGLSIGIITFVSASNGVAPKSIAASARLWSIERTFGYTLVITYGVQKRICARSIVKYPLPIRSDVNKIISPIAVTMSGFIIGILLIFNIQSFTTFLLFESPIAVIVPSTVETNVAIMAILSETYTDEIMPSSVKSFLYHLNEKPVNLVKDLDELKEKTIVTTIGK